MACGPELTKSVDGGPSPTTTACGNGASPAALVLRQVLMPDQDIVHREVELDRLAAAAGVGRDMLIAEE